MSNVKYCHASIHVSRYTGDMCSPYSSFRLHAPRHIINVMKSDAEMLPWDGHVTTFAAETTSKILRQVLLTNAMTMRVLQGCLGKIDFKVRK